MHEKISKIVDKAFNLLIISNRLSYLGCQAPHQNVMGCERHIYCKAYELENVSRRTYLV